MSDLSFNPHAPLTFIGGYSPLLPWPPPRPWWIRLAAQWTADICGISTEEMFARYGVIPIKSILNHLLGDHILDLQICREAAIELCHILRGDEDEDLAEDEEEEQDWEETRKMKMKQTFYYKNKNNSVKELQKNLKNKRNVLKIRLTVTRNGKRFPKSNKVLRKQIKDKLKSF